MVRSQGIRGAEGVIQMLGDCAGQGLVGNEIALSTPSISTAAKTRALLVPCAAIDYLECPLRAGFRGHSTWMRHRHRRPFHQGQGM